MRRALAVVLLASCGRVGFNAITRGDGGGATGDGSSLAIAYPKPRVYAVVDATPISLVPTVSEAATFSITPALPAGLALDATSGTISGVPHASAEATYTVTATAGGDSGTAAIELTALPGYVVDTTADTADANVDAICADAMGKCSLRAAITTANLGTGSQLVMLGANTYALGAALPAIASDVMIAGDGALTTTIAAETVHGAYAAFIFGSSHTLRLRDLAVNDFGGTDGGAIAVTLGTLDVDHCDFTNNASPGSGGVLFINGGAAATLAHCTFTANASLGGNGNGWGGVIDGEGAGTTIIVRQSFATMNHTAWGAFAHITTGTTLRLEDSTLYANTSTTAGTLASPGGEYTLVNDTIVGNSNTAGDSAGLYLFQVPAKYTVTNTIVAFNSDGTAEHDCNRRDLGTSLVSGGGNIFNDTAENCAMYFTAAGDRLSTDPGVEAGAPSDHGGETMTLLLAPGAAALTGGVVAACPALDQRDEPHAPGTCDVGAVQVP